MPEQNQGFKQILDEKRKELLAERRRKEMMRAMVTVETVRDMHWAEEKMRQALEGYDPNERIEVEIKGETHLVSAPFPKDYFDSLHKYVTHKTRQVEMLSKANAAFLTGKAAGSGGVNVQVTLNPSKDPGEDSVVIEAVQQEPDDFLGVELEEEEEKQDDD